MTGYCASSHPQSGLLLRVIPPGCLFVFRGSIKLSWHLVWIISCIMAPSFLSSHAFYQHNRPLMKYYKPPAPSLCIAELCKRAETKRVVGWRWYSNSKWCLQIGINNAGETAERFSRTVSLDRLLLKVLPERGLVKYVISGSCKHVMLRLVGGDIFNFRWVSHKGERQFLEMKRTSCGSPRLRFAIYNAFYAPLLCKRAVMKRVSSLRNGNPAAPPSPHPSSLPVVLCAAGGAALLTGGRFSTLHSNLKRTLLAPLSSPFHAGRRWWKILIIHIKFCPLHHCIFPELADFQHVF